MLPRGYAIPNSKSRGRRSGVEKTGRRTAPERLQ
jgi:hypothetical protein